MKKNVASKIIAGALASAMVLSMAACGEAEQTGSSTPSASTPSASTPSASTPSASTPTAAPAVDDGPIAFTYALPSDKTHTEDNEYYDRLVKELNEYLNADITWEWTETASYYEQLTLKYISGDLADVLTVGDDAVFLAAAEAGLFWDLKPYLDDPAYDNLNAISDAIIENMSYNGKCYTLPRTRNLGRNGFGYRLDWLNNLNLQEPTTWEAFETMLYEFTYSDPDGDGQDNTVGLYLDSWTGAWDFMMTWFGVPNEWGIDANGDLIHKCQTPEYKTALAEFRDLVAQGVVNYQKEGIVDFTVAGPGSARNEGLRTQIGGCGVQVLDDMRKVQTYFESEGITTEDEIIFTLQGCVDTGLGKMVMPTAGYNGLMAVSTKNIKTEEQLKKVLQVLNDMNDGECLNLVEYGWEGLTYKLDENGYVSLFSADELNASGVGSTTYNHGFNQMFTYVTAPENARPVVRQTATTPITILEAEVMADNELHAVPNYGASYTSDTYVAVGGQLSTILADAQLKYITGEIDEAGLDEQLKTWWTAGGEQVTKEMNELYHANK